MGTIHNAHARLHRFLWALGQLGCLALFACGDTDDNDGEDATRNDSAVVTLSHPVAMGDHLLLLEADEDWLQIVDASESAPRPERHALPPGAWHAEARRGDHGHALVLSEGLRGVDEDAALTRVDAEGKQVRHRLASAFDSIAQDADGQFAVAYHGLAPRRVVFSPNAIAVIRLDADEDAATHLSLRSPGGAPLALHVSPPLRPRTPAESARADGTLRFVVALSHNHVSLLDLSSPDLGELDVQLGGNGAEGEVTPTQLAFDADAGRMYVRCDGSDDIFVLTILSEQPDGSAGPWVEVAQVSGGASPTDMARLDSPDGSQLLVTSGEHSALRLVDPEALASQVVPADGDHSHVFGHGGGAVLYRPGSDRVGLIATGADGAARFAADPAAHMRSLRLDAPVERVDALGRDGLALVEHGPALFGVLDPRTGSELLLGLRSEAAVLVHAAAADALWFYTPGDHLIGHLALASGRTGEVLLDAPVVVAGLVPQAGRIALAHPDGTLTLVDTGDASRETAVQVPAAQ